MVQKKCLCADRSKEHYSLWIVNFLNQQYISFNKKHMLKFNITLKHKQNIIFCIGLVIKLILLSIHHGPKHTIPFR